MNNESLGTVTISHRAIKSFAAEVARRTEGVAGLRSRSRKDEIAEILSPKRERGVYYTKSAKKKILDIYITVFYGVSAKKICADISEKIKRELIDIGVGIDTVNVRVVGVR